MGRMYSISDIELLKFRNELKSSRGFIHASSSSCASPVLFVKSTHGTLRLSTYVHSRLLRLQEQKRGKHDGNSILEEERKVMITQ